MPTSSALVFADNASIYPDLMDHVAYCHFYHDRDVLVDPPSHAVAVFSQGRSARADIPVFPIHEDRFKLMLKRFPKLLVNPYPVDTEEIRDPHPGNMYAEMRTDGDIPMVDISVTTIEAFCVIRHWVYTQDQHSLVEAILGEQLAASVDPSKFSIFEPVYVSNEFWTECDQAAALSVASDSHEPSALTDAEGRITGIIGLATNWELINDEFWAVVLTLGRILPVARKSSRSVANLKARQQAQALQSTK